MTFSLFSCQNKDPGFGGDEKVVLLHLNSVTYLYGMHRRRRVLEEVIRAKLPQINASLRVEGNCNGSLRTILVPIWGGVRVESTRGEDYFKLCKPQRVSGS